MSQEGNLFASLMLRNPAPANVFAELTFVVSLAVREALAKLAQRQGVSRTIALKWPNDVLVSGRKVSGILLESHEAGGDRVVIVGIGVNCNSHPDETLHRATDLAAEGIHASADDVLVEISASLSNYLAIWNRGEGFEAIRAGVDERGHGHRAAHLRQNAGQGAHGNVRGPCAGRQSCSDAGRWKRGAALGGGYIFRKSILKSGHYPHMAMNELVFVPLGGVGEIGMNFALYGYGPAERREWIIVDCGVTFPGPDLPGVDLVMPDIRLCARAWRCR